MNAPTPADQPGPPPTARPTHIVGDELTLAKLRLLAGSETTPHPGTEASPMDAPYQTVRQHPYIAALAALAAGFIIMRFGVVRKLALGAALWGGKRLLTNYLSSHKGRG